MDGLLIGAIPLAPALGGVLNLAGARLLGPRAAPLAVAAMVISFACAVLAAALVIAHGPISLDPGRWTGLAGGLRADRLSVVMALLVTGISLLVHAFAARAMQGDRHLARFFAGLNMVSAAVLMVALSGSLMLLFLFWMAKGYILALLLAHYSDRPASRRAASKKMSIDLIGNTAFALAVVLVWHTFGTLDLAALAAQARGHAGDRLDLLGLHVAALTPIALLLLVAAMAKSAQVPLHAWLPDSLETPTPVSALMHAGLVNAGGFLLVRLSPLFALSAPAMHLAFAVGTLTALYGTAVMRTRSDVKGALAYSTMGQMGFMLMECGLGAFSLAILHLAAHGIFKATLFLGSGGAVAEGKMGRMLAGSGSQRARTANRDATAAIASLLVVALAAILIDRAATQGGAALLLLFAWTTGAGALARAGGTGSLSHLAGGVPVLAALGVAYFALVRGIAGFLAPVLPTAAIATAAAPGLGFVLPVAALLLIVPAWRLRGPSRSPWLLRIERQFYVLALHRGYGEELAGLVLSRPARRRARL